MIEITWAAFKDFTSSRSVPMQFIDGGNQYHLVAFDGQFNVTCRIRKRTSEAKDFEDNYKSLANRTPVSKVSQTLGTDSFSMSTRSLKFTGTMGTSTDHDKVLDAALVVRGGVLEVPNYTLGDTIKVQILDPSKTVVVDEFVSEWHVMSGQNELIDVSVSSQIPENFVVRLVYVSDAAATVNPVGVLNLISYEVQ